MPKFVQYEKTIDRKENKTKKKQRAKVRLDINHSTYEHLSRMQLLCFWKKKRKRGGGGEGSRNGGDPIEALFSCFLISLFSLSLSLSLFLSISFLLASLSQFPFHLSSVPWYWWGSPLLGLRLSQSGDARPLRSWLFCPKLTSFTSCEFTPELLPGLTKLLE